ncbi:antitoxin StbD [Clostridiales Family XIII bacterium PM5-7]
MKNVIPVSRLNRGEASKILKEIETSGHKVIEKNNTPIGVLLSVAEYESMIETLEDLELLVQAQERMNDFDGETISEDEIRAEFGITEEDLDKIEDVEFE